jgi:hypothetical protein
LAEAGVRDVAIGSAMHNPTASADIASCSSLHDFK